MNRRKKVLIIIPFKNAFIEKDIAFLSSEFDVKVIDQDWRNKSLLPFQLIGQFFSLLFMMKKYSAVLVEFGGYWSVIPSSLGKLFKTPVYIVLHGTDCAHLSSINYGSLRKKTLRNACSYSYRKAHMLVPVSQSLVQCTNDYLEVDQNQGFKNHFPTLSTPYKVIPNAIDTSFWKPGSKERKSIRFIAVFSEEQFVLKGGDLIIDIANNFPDCEFRIAGTSYNVSFGKLPSNVKFLGKLDKEDLRTEYQSATFHFQLSMFEGFGLALCEAMSCGCIPIVSNVNNLPDIIENNGFVLKSKDSSELTKLIESVIKSDHKIQMSENARARIVSAFNNEIRKNLLIETIGSEEPENKNYA